MGLLGEGALREVFDWAWEEGLPDRCVRWVDVGCWEREERGVPAGEGGGRFVAHAQGGEGGRGVRWQGGRWWKEVRG